MFWARVIAAIEKIEDWRRYYNEQRPHGAIDHKAPIMLLNQGDEPAAINPLNAAHCAVVISEPAERLCRYIPGVIIDEYRPIDALRRATPASKTVVSQLFLRG